MDAAIPADAQNAPTGIWKSRTEREIPTAPTPIIVVVNERKNNGDSNSVAKPSTESDQAQSDTFHLGDTYVTGAKEVPRPLCFEARRHAGQRGPARPVDPHIGRVLGETAGTARSVARDPEGLETESEGDRMKRKVEIFSAGCACCDETVQMVTRIARPSCEVRSGPRNLDSGLSEISIVFQAAVPKLVASKYTTSGVRRPSEL